MKCEIQRVNKNIRYRILSINNNDYYLVDMGQSLWKILFPFLFWIFPHTVYKIDDEDMLRNIQAPELKQAKTNYFSILGAGISILLANLLRPLMDYFNIQSSTLVNSIILIVVLIIAFLLRFYISNMNKKNLYKVAKTEQLSTDRLWIRPKSTKYCFQYLFFYLFFLGFTLISFVAFIEYGNVMMLFFATVFLFLLFIGSGMTVIDGNTTVKFKDDKKAVG
ncbi:hypothetical protein M948_05025 [Virgibacillus sp. CM-4]|uniref:Tandem five-TM protein n=1 Tax=Virgibacillus massiliensis TaxID=1462526 RepID=A0A024Q8N8_9BACI|nr:MULTISPECIES: DUF443 family protein [Virgibacillus]EQB37932.1 hypothetical protein M948_05025 [Virgibacillus sp. CM-4]CDQ38555.1 tandem five-TM protein [Virgibacillus massiliensis]